ncbi:hypothetical protein EV702DRAFT_1191554 [Suillus placidus]|uniref:Uncharacterized protein n=1 Tax=Suillus placidus TaxID=48579 RepID=A0A9P7A7X7_9AGAM|nr:hypothetical protein EV702DRAFT_1191554 [Suillus placidus]
MYSSAGCPHSSALNPTPTKESNFRNAQVVIALSKWPQYGTSRYGSPWCIYNRRGLMISVQALVVARGPKYEKAISAYQQQTQSHCQAQASTSHAQPADASTSTTPPAPGTTTTTTTAGATTPQSPPIPWWAQIVLFLCCASPPHANGHGYSQRCSIWTTTSPLLLVILYFIPSVMSFSTSAIFAVRLVQCVELDNVDCHKRRTVYFACFPLSRHSFSLLWSGLNRSLLQRPKPSENGITTVKQIVCVILDLVIKDTV